MLRDKDGQSCNSHIIVGHMRLEEKAKSLIVGPELTCRLPGEAIKDCRPTSHKATLYETTQTQLQNSSIHKHSRHSSKALLPQCLLTEQAP